MAIWPFNRNQTKSPKQVPQEVEQYYQSERRDRVGVAWLLAAGTLVLTVLIVLGLFFGGRWLYRKITNKDTTPTQTAQTNQPANQSTSGQSSSSSSGVSNGASTNSGSNSSSSSSSSATNQGNTSQGTVNAPTQAGNPSSVPSQPTQTSSGSLTNTGPGETITIFALASLAGYLGYSSYLKRRLN